MSVVLFLDSEQAALVRAGVEAIDAVLHARIIRADPEGLISATAKLQTTKITELHNQLGRTRPATWADLPPDTVAQIKRMAQVLSDLDQQQHHAQAWERLQALVLSARAPIPPHEPDADRDAVASAFDPKPRK